MASASSCKLVYTKQLGKLLEIRPPSFLLNLVPCRDLFSKSEIYSQRTGKLQYTVTVAKFVFLGTK